MKQTELNTLVINNIHSSKQNYRISSFIISLPFCWALITAVYLCLTFLGGGYVTALLGLFVPIGLMNFVLLLESGPLIVTLPLVLLTVFVGEWMIRKINMPSVLKFFVILIVLLVLTITVDLILWGNWQSLEFLKTGGEFDCC